ncbi:hypothetical protein M231_07063 [Tremella mesenterica]|uniref:Uncharacterized protein n=1 Tax=Tremella mesenterica TaxID=5217 RepID=A0A4V1M355_TREME|nr:hypothetical protein M231_07063 [Tremella mesenterica]
MPLPSLITPPGNKVPFQRRPGNPGFVKNHYEAKRIEPDVFYPNSPYHLQEFFDIRNPYHNPRPLNNSHKTFDRLLRKEKIELPPPTLIPSSQFPLAIPCSLNDAGLPNGRPKYWLMAYKLNSSRDNEDIMKASDIIKDIRKLPFHPGVRSPSNCRRDHTHSFLSKDARTEKTQQFVTTFRRIVGGGTFKNLRKFDDVTAKRMSPARLLVHHHLANHMEYQPAHSLPGQVGCSLADNKGQSEEWYFNRNDDDSTYSIMSVFGSGGWNSTAEKRQGWLVLPQLNVEIEMPIGTF